MTRLGNSNDKYGTVVVMVTGQTGKAWFMNRDGDQQTVAKQLVSYSSEQEIESSGFGIKLILEIKEWKLRELGWV